MMSIFHLIIVEPIYERKYTVHSVILVPVQEEIPSVLKHRGTPQRMYIVKR